MRSTDQREVGPDEDEDAALDELQLAEAPVEQTHAHALHQHRQHADVGHEVAVLCGAQAEHLHGDDGKHALEDADRDTCA